MGILIILFRQNFGISHLALRWCLFCSIFNAAMVYGLIGSVAYVPVSIAILIFFTHPILVAAIAHWRGSDRLTLQKAGLAFGVFTGLASALAPTIENVDPIGIVLATISAISISGAILCGAQAQSFATSTQVNFYVTAFTTAVFGILTFVLRDWSFPANFVGWLGVCSAGIAIAVGLLGFFAAFRYLGPVRTTMLGNVEPLFSILFAAAVLDEHLQPVQWIGVVVMIGAIVLFEAADRKDMRTA